MKTVIKTTMLAAALSFGLAACDGPKENAMEDAGEQNAEAVNDQAEAAADAGKITDEQADAMTNAAENKADAMEQQGEAIDQASGTATATDAAKQ
jgi:hypothetical protein